MVKIQKETTVGTERIYEISVLFVPELEGDALIQTVNSLKGYITDVAGKVISEGNPVYMHLAYTVEAHINNKIKKSDYANFYWVKFETLSDNIEKIEKNIKLKMEEQVLRFMTIKTIRENTQLTELASARGGSQEDDVLIEEVVKSEGEEAGANTITDVGAIKDSEIVTEAAAEVIKEETK
jgi:ribosomal protein S6